MQEIEIKDVTAASVRDLAEIHVTSWQEAYKGLAPQDYLDSLSVDDYEAKWQSWLKEVLPGFVAFDGDRAAGFVSYGKIRTRLPSDKGIVPLYSGEIYALYLRPEYWRRGIGRQLLAKAFEALRAEKHNGAALWVLKKNTRALAFYEALGGQRVGKQKTDVGGRMLDESAIGWRDLSV